MSNPQRQILLVDDDESLRLVLQMQLDELGYAVTAASSGDEALALLERFTPDLILSDIRMPGLSGLDLLARVRQSVPGVSMILMTAYGSIQLAVQAMKAGAYDFITKPVDHEELAVLLQRAFEHRDLLAEVQTLRATIDRKYGFSAIIGSSPVLLNVLDLAVRAAGSDSTVLIHGETGTGKELLARAVHCNSGRRDRPFVCINCGAIPRELLESELFGHTKGSFTGAMAHKPGKVESAHTGTLFLDEIGEMPLELQVKLLRLIQQGEIEKIGAVAAIPVDVRIIAATHRNLEAMIEDGAFREDLYYRLAVIPLELPPLRERPEDIPELLHHFFARAREKHKRPGLTLPAEFIPYFQAYRWPGNIRELENIVERLVVLARPEGLTLADLPGGLRQQRPPLEALQIDLPPEGISVDAVEKDLIVRALEKCHWNQTHAARYLDLSRKTLIYRMEKFGIRRPRS
ncbi:MAG TPA: sigma-54 dependent transcriptional regulator [Bryobacteraceae bacterium]|nr:DNA-binding response regulator [Bryobacterales bacterium]HRJ21028.1 sigma-54 dependent transcriptional regulator [Bryobacteraceae bacterium]